MKLLAYTTCGGADPVIIHTGTQPYGWSKAITRISFRRGRAIDEISNYPLVPLVAQYLEARGLVIHRREYELLHSCDLPDETVAILQNYLADEYLENS